MTELFDMPDTSYQRLDGENGGWLNTWRHGFTTLEKFLMLFGVVSIIIILGLSIALGKCTKDNGPVTTTVAPTTPATTTTPSTTTPSTTTPSTTTTTTPTTTTPTTPTTTTPSTTTTKPSTTTPSTTTPSTTTPSTTTAKTPITTTKPSQKLVNLRTNESKTTENEDLLQKTQNHKIDTEEPKTKIPPTNIERPVNLEVNKNNPNMTADNSSQINIVLKPATDKIKIEDGNVTN